MGGLMRSNRLLAFLSVIFVCTTSVFSQTATTFTYQGFLTQSGLPAEGAYDFEVRLLDDVGAQIGVTQAVSAVVTMGTFTVELDFGVSAFDGNPRFLELSVRLAADGGAYTLLSPNQPIHSTPVAQFALEGNQGPPGADGNDSLWQTSGSNMYYNDGFVGVGRSISVSPQEEFGVHSSTTSDYGGMYVSTDGGTSLPFYGYFSANTVAWTYLDSVSGSWNVSVNSEDKFTVTPDGFVGIGTMSPGYRLSVESLGSRTISAMNNSNSFGVEVVHAETAGISGTAIHAVSSSPSGPTVGVRSTVQSSSGYAGYFEGGRNYFSGDVGIGTILPTAKLDVLSSSTSAITAESLASTGTVYAGEFTSHSNAGAAVRGHASSQTGNIYGGEFVCSSTSGSGVFGVSNAVNGSAVAGSFLGFSPSGHAGSFQSPGADAVYIENTGTGRGLRVVAPSDTAIWGLSTTGFAGIQGQNASSTGLAVYGFASSSSGVNYGVYGKSNSASGFDFYAGGAGMNYGSSSSRRWKHNIIPISDPLAKIAKLRGVYYDWDQAHGGAHDLGMIAEEVGEVLPEIVRFEENGVDAIGMDYSKMTPLLVEAVNAIQAERSLEHAKARTENQQLKDEMARLRQENKLLKMRLDRLEQALVQSIDE